MVEVIVSKHDSEQPQTKSLFCEILDFVASKSPEGEIPQGFIVGALQIDPIALRVFTHIREKLIATSLQTACATRTDPEIVYEILEAMNRSGILNKTVEPDPDLPGFLLFDGIYSVNRNALRIGRQLNLKIL